MVGPPGEMICDVPSKHYSKQYLSALILGAAALASQAQDPFSGAYASPPSKDPGQLTQLPTEGPRPAPMAVSERLRRNLVPVRGLVSTGINGGTFISGDGTMTVELAGDPLSDEVIFRHEAILRPWKRPFAAPDIAAVLPDVKRLILAGEYRQALELSLHAANDAGMPPGTTNHSLLSPFRLRLSLPPAGAMRNYLRSVDFETGEIAVHWTDDRGDWVRKTFVSRPDHVAVESMSAPAGHLLDTDIALNAEQFNRPSGGGDAGQSSLEVSYKQSVTPDRLTVMGRFQPEFGNIGFAGVTRVVTVGGTAVVQNGVLKIRGARSAILLTRIESYEDYEAAKVERLSRSLDALAADYAVLLEKQRKVQAEYIERMSIQFKGAEAERGLSTEELLSAQRERIGYSPALLQQIFDMGRYWLFVEGTGEYPSIAGHLNINVNLQIAPAAMANAPEATATFTHWIEGLLPDSRVNARNLFGAGGAFYTVHPDQEQGVMYHFAFNWPHQYWISAGGWAYSPIWDSYLTTGDPAFLRDHIVPGLKELALFYQDFLTEKDVHGDYIFVPSYSPENWPSNTDSTPTVINSVMDIAVCKEVLTHLIEASSVLGTEADQVPKWQKMLDQMPPYLLDTDGALKEWAWPTLAENQDHRHISHMYPVWPGDEIDPDRTPLLAKAAWLANRKRAQGNASGHGISHRALAAARLKDSYLVNEELKQFFEQGYLGPTLRTSHNPYTSPMPDQQGSIPTIMMEMLLYSRPGVLEVLPAIPDTLTAGTIKGMQARTFVTVNDLTWDFASRMVSLTITSRRKQDLNLFVRYGIASIHAPAGVLGAAPAADATNCMLHLEADVPVTLAIHLGSQHPSDWVLKVADQHFAGAAQ